MLDTRLVCDLSPAELIEAGIAAASSAAWSVGHWEIVLGIVDGVLRQIKYPTLIVEGRVLWATVGRRQLDRVVESEAA